MHSAVKWTLDCVLMSRHAARPCIPQADNTSLGSMNFLALSGSTTYRTPTSTLTIRAE